MTTCAKLSHDLLMVTGAGRLREGGRDMVIDPGRPEDETPGMGGVQVLKEIVYASCKINKYKRETGVYLIFFSAGAAAIDLPSSGPAKKP